MALPVLTHYFYAPHPGGLDWAGSNTAVWDPPSGVVSNTPPAGLVFYGLIFGPVASVSVTPSGWTLVTSGSVGGSNFFLFRRDTGSSEPALYQFDYDELLPEQSVTVVGIGVAGAAWDLAGAPQFAIGDTASSGALTVPATGNVLSVHIWGGMSEPPHHTWSTWEPDPAEFPSDRCFGYGQLFSQYVAKIGEVRNVATAPGRSATLAGWPGLDNFGIQFLFSDAPAGWGIGMIRMGPN